MAENKGTQPRTGDRPEGDPPAQQQKFMKGLHRALVGPSVDPIGKSLEQRLDALKHQKASINLGRRIAFVLAVGALIVAVLGGFGSRGVWLFVSVAIAGVASYFTTAEVDLEIRDITFEMDAKGAQTEAERARKLFKDHQAELRRYYDLARSNNQVMLVIGVLCLALGGGIVLAAGWLILDPPAGVTLDTWSEVIIGALGAVGGILINYVAAVYLKMYALASQTLNDFHNRLVTTHHLHLGNYVASRIEDETKREDAFKEMAIELSKL